MRPPFDKLRLPGPNPAVNIIVDTPKGNRSKVKYDEEAGSFRLSHILPEGASFTFSVRGTTWNPGAGNSSGIKVGKNSRIAERFRS